MFESTLWAILLFARKESSLAHFNSVIHFLLLWSFILANHLSHLLFSLHRAILRCQLNPLSNYRQFLFQIEGFYLTLKFHSLSYLLFHSINLSANCMLLSFIIASKEGWIIYLQVFSSWYPFYQSTWTWSCCC